MNNDSSLDRAARSWLEDGPTRAPEHAVSNALARIESTQQERRLWPALRLPMFRPLGRMAAVALVALVAISGSLYLLGGGPRFGAQQTPSPTGRPSNGPTSTPAGSPAPTADPAACALVTAQEAESLAGIQGLGALPNPSGSGDLVGCIYANGGGDVVLRLSYRRIGGDADLQAVRDTPGVEAVAGYGDESIFDPTLGTLYVRTGDALLSIVTGSSADAPESRLAKDRSIAAVAVGRTESQGACHLVTAAEAESVAAMVGFSTTPAQSGNGDTTTCLYGQFLGTGDIVLRTVLIRVGASAALDAVRGNPGVQVVADEGDEALFDPTTGILYVRKADALLSIATGTYADAPASSLAKDRLIAEIALPRL